MGSHTARFASLCAEWFEKSNDLNYKEWAVRSLNWATYMSSDDGTVTVGVDRPDYYNQCWFTDGYFDYIPHFIDMMASIPETAPDDSDHILRTSTIIKQVNYCPNKIQYQTFDKLGNQKIKTTFEPVFVKSGNRILDRFNKYANKPGWSFDSGTRVLEVFHDSSEIDICAEII
jgi:hypothetical protein